jgi:ketosteroid isomerase-like protein
MTREELIDQAACFVDAFNRNDLDAVMGHFAADAIYDEFNGRRHAGLEAIRAAFVPQFTGAYGEMKFIDEDLFVDTETGKVMASWRCTLSIKGRATAWHGLDLMYFKDGKLVAKSTYAKAASPLFE